MAKNKIPVDRRGIPKMSRAAQEAKTRAMIRWGVTALLLIVGLLVVLVGQPPKSNTTPSSAAHSPSETSRAVSTAQESVSRMSSGSGSGGGEITSGTASNVGYYHCAQAKADTVSLVFLHGMKFTKENWKSSGILQQFCSKGVQATALDLNVRVTAKELQEQLQALAVAGLIKLPVTGLITPSASGKAVTEWIQSQGEGISSDDFSKFVKTWIPVAPVAMLRADKSLLEKVKNWDILAIYGDQDQMGKKVSDLMGEANGATVKELKGTHPVYLDSPDDFVKTIVDYLKIP